jgi:magnesium transporter
VRALRVTAALRAPKRDIPGTSPGTLNVDPEASPPRIYVISYDSENLIEREVTSVEELRPLLDSKRTTWINIDGLGNADTLRAVGALFDLHALALEDVVATNQRPKMESYQSHLFIIAHMPVFESGISTEQVGIFLGSSFVLTFQEREQPGDCFDPVRRRIREGTKRLRTLGPGYLAYALLDTMIDSYFPVVERFSVRLDELEAEALERPAHDLISRIHLLKHDIASVRRVVWPQREAIQSLIHEESSLISAETRLYLRDCADHAQQLRDHVEITRELASELMNFHMSNLSSRLTEVLKVLTIISTLFMPLSFIAGVYGMNFDPSVSPWNMPELRWAHGYPFSLGIMAAVAIAMLLYFKRKGLM